MQITSQDANNLFYLRTLANQKDVLRFIREYLLALNTFGKCKVSQIDTQEILLKRGVQPSNAAFLKGFCLWLANCQGVLRRLIDNIIKDVVEGVDDAQGVEGGDCFKVTSPDLTALGLPGAA